MVRELYDFPSESVVVSLAPCDAHHIADCLVLKVGKEQGRCVDSLGSEYGLQCKAVVVPILDSVFI